MPLHAGGHLVTDWQILPQCDRKESRTLGRMSVAHRASQTQPASRIRTDPRWSAISRSASKTTTRDRMFHLEELAKCRSSSGQSRLPSRPRKTVCASTLADWHLIPTQYQRSVGGGLDLLTPCQRHF